MPGSANAAASSAPVELFFFDAASDVEVLGFGSVAATATTAYAVATGRRLLAIVDVLRQLRVQWVGVKLRFWPGETVFLPRFGRLQRGAACKRERQRKQDFQRVSAHSIPSERSATRKKRANLILDRAFSVIAEAYFDVDNGPARIDQIGAWHAFNRVRLRRSTLVIVDHGEARGIGLKKLLRVGTAPIDVDCDNGKAAVTVALLHLIHPRERSSTRRAPRSPKIDVYDPAAKIRERHRLAVSGHKRKRRRRLADLRRARSRDK